MSTTLHDVGANAIIRASFPPSFLVGPATGGTVDLADGDGNGFVILTVGDISEDWSATGTLHESDDGSAWTPVAGVAFDTMATTGATQVRSFRRTKRYVRLTVAVDGTDPEVMFSGLIGQQKKTV